MIVDSTNPRIMADNIRELAKNGGGGGSVLPEVTSADNGKILGVVEGSWNKMDVPSGIVDYSTTEQDTGQKWTNGKSIYQKTFTLSSGSLATKSLLLPTSDLAVDEIIEVYGSLFNNTESRNYALPYFRATLNESILISADTRSGLLHIELASGITSYTDLQNISVTVFYTKPTTETKKRKTTKGEN